jgi:hypothetical protein
MVAVRGFDASEPVSLGFSPGGAVALGVPSRRRIGALFVTAFAHQLSLSGVYPPCVG